jgi:hypothetical protein
VTRRRDDGQATVELALGLPVVLLTLLALAQVVVVVAHQVAVVHAAREGARAAAVAADGADAARVAVSGSLGTDRAQPVTVAVAVAGDRVEVTVSQRVPTDVPLVGAFVGDVTVTGHASMQVEP